MDKKNEFTHYAMPKEAMKKLMAIVGEVPGKFSHPIFNIIEREVTAVTLKNEKQEEGQEESKPTKK